MFSSKGQETRSVDVSKTITINDTDKYGSIPTQSSSAPMNNYDDDFDDFDPRGTSSAKPSAGTSHQVDLFGQDLLGDLLDAPISVPTEMSASEPDQPEVDLFADATFVSATSPTDVGKNFDAQKNVDLFSAQPAPSSAVSSTVDLFAASDPVAESDKKSTSPDQVASNAVDPFAAVPLNSFDASDPFGAFAQTPANDSSPTGLNGSVFDTKPGSQNNLNGSSVDSKPQNKKDAFQVKSGIWADSLSRGIIDLNITAPKKVNLADVGIVGGLTDGSDEKEKGPSTAFYMGRAMGAGTGLGKSGFTSAEGDNFFASLSSQQYQFGGFKK